MSTCYGCGLRINGVDDSLEVATSEEWGAGDLAGYGGDDTSGAPVYCDSNGQLRTVPEHTSTTFTAAGSQGSTAVGDGQNEDGASTQVVVNNPSAVRAASIVGSVSVIEQLDWANGDPSFAPQLNVLRNSVPLYSITGLFTIPGDPLIASSFWWTYSADLVDSVAAGASVIYDAGCSVDATAGTSGSFASAVSIRGLVVTQ